MFAVIEVAGRQYKVSVNEKIDVDHMDNEVGATLDIDRVLMVAETEDNAKIGQPYVEGASVSVKVVEQFKGEKIRVFKFIPKKRHSKSQGHRQQYTKLEIISINL